MKESKFQPNYMYWSFKEKSARASCALEHHLASVLTTLHEPPQVDDANDEDERREESADGDHEMPVCAGG